MAFASESVSPQTADKSVRYSMEMPLSSFVKKRNCSLSSKVYLQAIGSMSNMLGDRC